MQYTRYYSSPLGEILLAADDQGLAGLWFVGQKYYAKCLEADHEEKDTAILDAACEWLDTYFAGKATTYGEISKQIAAHEGLKHMSAQAVGGAVGRNEISIIIPCHRVVGSDGSLTGYAGGIDKKAALLKLESAASTDDALRKLD